MKMQWPIVKTSGSQPLHYLHLQCELPGMNEHFLMDKAKSTVAPNVLTPSICRAACNLSYEINDLFFSFCPTILNYTYNLTTTGFTRVGLGIEASNLLLTGDVFHPEMFH